MKRQIAKRETSIQFDRQAHEIIKELLNGCEDALVRNGHCKPEEVEEFLCREYIDQVASVLWGASYFLQSDASAAAEIFLSKLTGKMYSMGKHWRHSRACGNQLSLHTAYYFRRYHDILTQVYVERLHAVDDNVLLGLNHDGVIQLAAASLPDVRDEVRREMRRRGLKYDALIVSDDDRDRRLNASKLHLRLTNEAGRT